MQGMLSVDPGHPVTVPDVKDVADELQVSIAAEASTPEQRRLTGAVIVVIVLGFLLTLAFALHPLPRSDGFVPAVQSIMFAFDLLTAILLFGQFAVTGSRALNALATGYLASGLFAAAHTLTFPGALTPNGLFGAGTDTAGWLYIAWHACFPLAVIAYCRLPRNDVIARSDQARSIRSSVLFSLLGSVALVVSVTWLLIQADGSLPRFVTSERQFNPVVRYIAGGNLVLTILALSLLQRRRASLLDEWIRVAAAAAVAESALVVLVASRFTVAFYSVRIYALLVAGAVLAVLLWQTTILFAKHAAALASLERERDNKLMNLSLMLASVAHEVKQPLAVIALRTGIVRRLLRSREPDLDVIHACLDEVEQSGDRLLETIDGVRSLFRHSAADRESIDVHRQLLQASLRPLEPVLDRQDIALELETERDLPAIVGHKRQLQEVVSNIARNAVEAMETVSDRARVLRLRAESAGKGRIVISIEDSGSGIAPDRLESIFESLTTTKRNGTGLGLGICRMIVDQHRGELQVRSEIGRGSEFRIVLPIQAADPNAADSPAPEPGSGVRQARPELHESA